MRSYVIPANPQSVDQTTQRTRFQVIQGYVRQVLSTLVQPYWDPYYTSMSGYNAITSNWLLNAPSSNLLTAAVSISKGTLASTQISSATYNTSGGSLAIVFPSAASGNQLATDTQVCVVFDDSTGLLYVKSNSGMRMTGSNSYTLPAGLTATNLLVFLFFVQGSGSSMIVSDSTSVDAIAA